MSSLDALSLIAAVVAVVAAFVALAFSRRSLQTLFAGCLLAATVVIYAWHLGRWA